MPAKIFITAPHCLPERTLRHYLHDVRLRSITYAPSVHGALWSVELSTEEDLERAIALLTTVTLQHAQTLSIVPADSPAGRTIAHIFSLLAYNRA
jgi:hypothetical protein